MSTDLLIKNDVISRAWNKVDILAEAKGMTREEFIEWSKAEYKKKNISGYEFDLICSYQISKAIERLEINNKNVLAEDTRRKYPWINRFKDDFIKVDQAIKHLQEVCEYVEGKEVRKYDYEWLLDYDDILYDRIIEGNEKKNKKYILKRND